MLRRRISRTCNLPALSQPHPVTLFIDTEQQPPRYLIRSNKMVRAEQSRLLSVTAYRFVYFVLGHIDFLGAPLKKISFPIAYLKSHVFTNSETTAEVCKTFRKIMPLVQSYSLRIEEANHQRGLEDYLFTGMAWGIPEAEIVLKLNPDFRKHVCRLKSEFTKIHFNYLMRLRSASQIRFYEYLKSYSPNKLPVIKISINSLYEHIGYAKNTPFWKFKRDFLEPNQKRFLKLTDRTFELESEYREQNKVIAVNIRVLESRSVLKKFSNHKAVIKQFPLQEQRIVKEVFNDIERWRIEMSAYQLYQMNKTVLKKGIDYVDSRCSGKSRTQEFLDSL